MADDAVPAFDDIPSFDDLPDAGAPQASASGSAGVPAFDDIPSFDALPDQSKQSQQRPTPEGPFKSALREAAHAVIPAVVGTVGAGAGAAVGALTSPVTGPVGPIAGGVAGYVGGSMVGDELQNKALDALGFNDDTQRAANADANPKSAFVGGLAPAVATMSPVGIGETIAKQALQRGTGAAMMGGFEGGQEYLNSGELDPTKIAIAAATGAVFPAANRVGEKLMNAGGKMVPGRPNVQANPAADAAHVDAGASQDETVTGDGSLPQTAPSGEGTTTGNPQSAPERSSRQYPKDNRVTAPQDDMLTTGDMDPGTRAALGQSLELNAISNEHPTAELPPKQGVGSPGEALPIHTGIEEAGAAQQAAPAQGQVPPFDMIPGFDDHPSGVGQAAPKPNSVQSDAGLVDVSAMQRDALNNVRKKVSAQQLDQEPGPGTLDANRAAAPAGPPKAEAAIATSKANAQKPKLGLKGAPEEAGPTDTESVLRKITGKTDPAPSDAQKEAGNYSKAREREFGHEIALEGMKGSERSGVGADGQRWTSTLPADYGYFRKTIGADKDHVDVYRGESGDQHFIVDQRNPETGRFDEHKVMTNFKDIDEARDTYLRGFSDDKGLSRLHDITPISSDDLTQWLKGASKKKPYGTPMPKVAKTPKVVTATVKALRDSANPEHAKIADALEALPPDRQVAEATRANAMLTNRTGKVPTGDLNPRIRPKPPSFKVGDTEVTGRTLADVEAKKGFLAQTKSAFDAHPPAENETKLQMRERLEKAVEMAGNGTKYKPRVPPAEWLWTREAQRYLKGSQSDAKADQFRANEKLLRSGKPEDVDLVRGTNRIEGDIAMSRRTGEDAISSAENRSAFDTPHEEAESMVEPEPVKSAADLKKLNNKELDLTKPADADVAAIDTDKITKNIIKQADARKAEASKLAGNKSGKAVGESEGAASEVRKIKIDDPEQIKKIMDAANKAANKGKGLDALPAAREDETVTPKIKDLFDRFGSDTSGALNYKRVANDFKTQIKPIRKWLESAFGTPLGEVGRKSDAILARAMSTEDSMNAEKVHLLDARWYQWTKNSTPAEQLTYLKTIEKSPATDRAGLKADLEAAGISPAKSDWMADEAQFHRDLMDKIWLEDAKHGSTADYIERYVPHIFEDSKGAADFIEARIKTLGANWYQKERVFDLLDAALKAGFKMKYSNPIDLVNARLAASIKSNTIVAAARALHNDGLAFPIKDAPKSVKNTWTMVRNLPDHQQWVFAPGVESMWKNSVEAKGFNEMDGLGGSIYRGWMKIKRVVAPIQLAFSAFHELHVAANINPAMNIARALKLSAADPGSSVKNALNAIKWSLTDPLLSLPVDKIGMGLGKALDGPNGRFSNFAGRKAQQWWQTPVDQLDANGRMWKRLFQEGGISPYQSKEDLIGAKRDFAKALQDKSLMMIPQGIRRGIEKLQEPMFKYQIPALKNVAYMRNVAAAIKMDPELVSNAVKRGNVLREIGKDVDDRFGEMFYKGLFWNKYAKDAGIGSMLSLSWNLGQLRQTYGAAKNVVGMGSRALGYKGSPMAEAKYHASDKAAFVGSYVGLSMATAGAISYMLTGSLPSGLDYIFPQNGLKNADGSPQRMSTPFNTREPFMLKAHAEQHNSWVGGAMEFLWNKMMLSPLTEIAQNKDFYGAKLYDPNTAWYKKGLQALDSTLGRSFNPISLSGADRAAQLGGGAKEKALAYAGFNPAPKYVNASPMENRINHLFSDEGTPSSKPYEYGPKTGLGKGLVQGAIRSMAGDKLPSEARQEGRSALDQAGIRGDTNAAGDARRELVEQGGLSARTVSKMRPDQEFQYKFARLPKDSQIALARDMSPAEFNKFVIVNNQAGISKVVKAQLIKERSTSDGLPSR